MAAVAVAIPVPRILVPVLVLVSAILVLIRSDVGNIIPLGVGVGSKNMQRADIVIECVFYTH